MNLSSISNTGFEVIVASLLANVIAQITKTIVNAFQKKSWESRMLYSTGGMPSSHSSTVTAIATSIGLVDGFASTTFALGAGIAAIVMYDAAGVRLAASKQAEVLNEMIKELFSLHPTLKGTRLKELLGHTPIQVLAGAGVGIGVSYAFHYYLTGTLF
ncbi:MAG: divergent PAP2 family protein [Bacteroidia bacterium]|nr:divergent PAP2 family protein [Bacteroidia bacterium]